MKTAAKVFIILSMVLMFWAIFPLVIGIFALKTLDNPEAKDGDVLVWGIVTLIFCSFLGGIFMLLSRTYGNEQVEEAPYQEEPAYEEPAYEETDPQ